jgi:hypothetical protein
VALRFAPTPSASNRLFLTQGKGEVSWTRGTQGAALAAKAHKKLQKKYARIVFGQKPHNAAATAVARELCGFIFTYHFVNVIEIFC